MKNLMGCLYKHVKLPFDAVHDVCGVGAVIIKRYFILK
jgi:hypothetical protein